MSDFLPNVMANLIGTFVGAGLAVGAAVLLDRRREAARERRLLQSLIERLYRSRALAPGRTRPAQPLSPTEVTDQQRCAQSVIDTRDRIGMVRDEISIHVKSIASLEKMYVHCLVYLDAVFLSPERYVELLMQLRSDLASDIDELIASIPSLDRKEPGTAQQLITNNAGA